MDYTELLKQFQEEQAYNRTRFAQLEAEQTRQARSQEQLNHRVSFLEARLDSVYADTLRELEGKLESAWNTIGPLLCSGMSPRQVEHLRAKLFDCLNAS